MNMKIVCHIPAGLIGCSRQQIHEVLNGPTLLKLVTRPDKPFLFISTLLHGNEDSSFHLLQHLICNFKNYNCNLLVFVGNTEAAAQGLRKLPHQPDYNRIWNGDTLAEEKLGKELLTELRRHQIFAAIDVHNTSGENPFYACVNRLDEATRNLASHFSPDLIYFTEPREVLSLQLTELFPTVVIECGKTGRDEGAQAAIQYIEKIALTGPSILSSQSFHRVYESFAIIHADSETTFSLLAQDSNTNCTFLLNPELEKLNFRKTGPLALLGKMAEPGLKLDQIFWTNHPGGLDQYLYSDKQNVYFRPDLVAMMLTLNFQIIKDDCLCYLLREIQID
jgi:succinylglutamate desuccinylase